MIVSKSIFWSWLFWSWSRCFDCSRKL